MNDILQLGPFVLNKSLLVLIASLVCGWGAIRLRLRVFGEAAAPALELMLNAALIVLLFWKFGHALFAPSLIWQRPMSLLLMSGAAREVGIGLLAATAFIMYRTRKMRLPIRLLLDLLAYGATAALAAYSLLRWRYGSITDLPWGISDGYGYEQFHPLNIYMFIVSGLVGFRLWRKAEVGEAASGRIFQEAAILLGIGGMLVSFCDNPGEPVLLYLTAQQLLWLGLAAIGVIFPVNTHNTGEKGADSYETNGAERRLAGTTEAEEPERGNNEQR